MFLLQCREQLKLRGVITTSCEVKTSDKGNKSPASILAIGIIRVTDDGLLMVSVGSRGEDMLEMICHLLGARHLTGGQGADNLVTPGVLVISPVLEVVVGLHVVGAHHSLGLEVTRSVLAPDHHLDLDTLVRLPTQQLAQGPIIDPHRVLASEQPQLSPDRPARDADQVFGLHDAANINQSTDN